MAPKYAKQALTSAVMRKRLRGLKLAKTKVCDALLVSKIKSHANVMLGSGIYQPAQRKVVRTYVITQTNYAHSES